MKTIAEYLETATQTLATDSPSPRLDAEILLAQVLQVARSYFLAYPEQSLTKAQEKLFLELISKRLQGIPIAYLTQHREFWSLDFMVTEATLIPRPETELLVELVLQKLSATKHKIADLGTGSGAIAVAIAHERPAWEIHATDASVEALRMAKLNAERLNTPNIVFHQGEWYAPFGNIADFDAIVSNPPYIDVDDPHLHENDVRFEPRSALIAKDQGLDDLRSIINNALSHLKPGGYLLVEHGYEQAPDVIKFFQNAGFAQIESHQDLAQLNRVVSGRKPIK